MDNDARPKDYWENTSNSGILLTYDTLHSTEDNLWSVLLMTGYITWANPCEDVDSVSLKIPRKK